ncbi:uncharacterized protein LOC120495683 [Passer montanus]|uniref:uncharacterized protein LOC120495683 n=1 Tax=Passer montanus TaxID=9160 RepID=UPI00196097F0|nr:uncharacterized protein LOC120495683 [Passer montanus]
MQALPAAQGRKKRKKMLRNGHDSKGCPRHDALQGFSRGLSHSFKARAPRARVAWSWSQHSPHTGVAPCDCSHTLVSSFAQLYSHEANIPSRTAWTSCKALLSCGDSLEFPMGKSLLLPSPASPEANHYQAGTSREDVTVEEGGWRRTPHSWLATALHSSPSLHCAVKRELS